MKKKIKTVKILPLPWLNKLPRYMKKIINDVENILFFKPNIKPYSVNIIIISIFPCPISKNEPTYPINIDAYIIEKKSRKIIFNKTCFK